MGGEGVRQVGWRRVASEPRCLASVSLCIALGL